MKQALEAIQLRLAVSTLLKLWQQFEELVRKVPTGKNFSVQRDKPCFLWMAELFLFNFPFY
jgi:hypothetical protein